MEFPIRTEHADMLISSEALALMIAEDRKARPHVYMLRDAAIAARRELALEILMQKPWMKGA